MKYFLLRKNNFIFFALIAVMFSIKLFDIVFAPNHVFPGRTAVFPWTEIGLAFVFGFIGLKLYQKIGWPDWLSDKINNRQRFVIPIFSGIFLGLLFMLFDYFARMGNINVGWPLSPAFYLWGGIFSELVLHLFLVSFFAWFISNVIFKKKHEAVIFWIVAALVSSYGVIGMLSAVNNPDIPLSLPNDILMMPLGILIFFSEITVLFFLRKYGLLSALAMRLSFYLMWHVIWGGLYY